MNRIRLVYEQIEEAKTYLLSKSIMRLRLTLILLDNVAELMMYESLRYRFEYDDQVIAPLIKKSEQSGIPLAFPMQIRYSTDERREAERDFEGMIRLLDARLGYISRADRNILSVAHRLRREAFHRGFLREDILQPVCNVLFRTVVGLTIKLKPKSMSHSAPLSSEEKGFLARFKVSHPSRLLDEDERVRISEMLVEGLGEFDAREFANLLSQEVELRIEQALDGLKEVAAGSDNEEDLNILFNHEEFWQEKKRELEALERPDRDMQREVFRQWTAEGKLPFSVRRVSALQRKATLIARQKQPDRALSLYWHVEKQFESSERRIGKIVADFDDWVNLQIDIARGK